MGNMSFETYVFSIKKSKWFKYIRFYVIHQFPWGFGYMRKAIGCHDWFHLDRKTWRTSTGSTMGSPSWDVSVILEIPSGKHTKNYGKSPCYSWENPLFLWPFSIAMLVYQRVFHIDGKVGEMTGVFSSHLWAFTDKNGWKRVWGFNLYTVGISCRL